MLKSRLSRMKVNPGDWRRHAGDQKTRRLAPSLVKAARFLSAFETHHKQSSSDMDTRLKELSKLTDDSRPMKLFR